MGLLDIFTHIPRTFKIVFNERFINDETPQHENTKDVLAEIYEIAAYLPITITVGGPEQVFQVEVNEHGDTCPPELLSQVVDIRGWQ